MPRRREGCDDCGGGPGAPPDPDCHRCGGRGWSDPLEPYRHRLEAAERCYDEALEYAEHRDHAERLAIRKARDGDLHGAYDDAVDHAWAIAHVAVRVAGWLAGGAP